MSLGKGPTQVSERLSESLTNFFRSTNSAKVLSQFQRDESGKIGTEVETIRKYWYDDNDAAQYRVLGADGALTGWSKPARALMCQAILTSALRHIAERRQNATQQAHIAVESTAIISGDGKPLSRAQKLERTHRHVLNTTPDAPFLHVRHKKMITDVNALKVVHNAMSNRPMDAVVIGYAGGMSVDAKEVRGSLHPEEGDSDYAVADFGRSPLASLHATTAGLASAAVGMKDDPRFNFSFPVAKVQRAAQCSDAQAKARLNMTTSDLNVHIAIAVSEFFKEMNSRPDMYDQELGMFASDAEKGSMYLSGAFYLAAIGKAEKESTGVASQLQEPYETTRVNLASVVGQRIQARWESAVKIATAVRTVPPPTQSPPITPKDLGEHSDSDDDMRACAQFLERSRNNAPTAMAPDGGFWAPHPEGTMGDAIAALAVGGAPSVIISFSPETTQPLTQAVEWDDGIFPTPLGDTVSQETSTLSRTYVPAGPDDPDEDQRGNNAVTWINRYLEQHAGWTVLLSRHGNDGRFSFTTLVRRKMAPRFLRV